jgi:Raf kinase inhibitor-like YbhB/YbcL family protein
MSTHTLAIALLLLGAGAHSAGAQLGGPPLPPRSSPGFTVSTPAFPDGGQIPRKYTQGVTMPVSPPLKWENVPEKTVSFVVLLRDPDVALKGTIEEPTHWLLFNIPGTATGLPEGVPNVPRLPDGSVQGKNRRGFDGYQGPGAPAPGPNHHYLFEVYAVGIKLDLGPEATRDQVLKAINGHILGKAIVVGLFHL